MTIDDEILRAEAEDVLATCGRATVCQKLLKRDNTTVRSIIDWIMLLLIMLGLITFKILISLSVLFIDLSTFSSVSLKSVSNLKLDRRRSGNGGLDDFCNVYCQNQKLSGFSALLENSHITKMFEPRLHCVASSIIIDSNITTADVPEPFGNETTSWTGINECLNDVEKTILGTSVALFILATFGMYYAYKVMRNYQIRPFMLRFCVKPADYYLGEVIDAAEEQFQRTSTPTYDDDFDQTLVDSVIAKKKKRRR